LVIDGEQKRAVVFGTPIPGPHVLSNPFAMGHRCPAHRIKSVHGHNTIERFVARGQRPKSQSLFAVLVQKSSTHQRTKIIDWRYIKLYTVIGYIFIIYICI